MKLFRFNEVVFVEAQGLHNHFKLLIIIDIIFLIYLSVTCNATFEQNH